MERQYFVYILASQKNGTLYIGVTSNLPKRIWEHKSDQVDSFTKRYSVKDLVYYEAYTEPESAILREKRLKKWERAWKLRLIEEKNPEWEDLYPKII
ncbi:MAG: GIY-YIG nuclease family protein [Desulfobacterales bacterium]|nr:GIY-YIG nuclease family protein [Desulfobacterales bacterium]